MMTGASRFAERDLSLIGPSRAESGRLGTLEVSRGAQEVVSQAVVTAGNGMGRIILACGPCVKLTGRGNQWGVEL